MKNTFTHLLFCCFFGGLSAQTISTLVPPEAGIGYEAVNWNPQNGRVLIPDWINGFVHEIDMEGSRTALLEGIAGPLGGAWDLEGNFYVSEYGTGNIIRLAPDGSDTIVAGGFGGPAGMLVDSAQQILYVADYDGSVIRRLYLDDFSSDTLVAGSGLNGPDCIVYAPNGDLIVNNFNNNLIFKVSTAGDIEVFSTLVGSLNSGYLVRRGEEYIVAGFYSHRLWLVDAEGNASIWAGTANPGQNDGPLSEAQFSQPNGIGISPDGDSLIVSDGVGTQARLRLITGLNGNPSSTISQAATKNVNLLVSPNPANGPIRIDFELAESRAVTISLYDLKGNLLDTVTNKRTFTAGTHQLNWQLPTELPNGYYQCILRIGQSIATKPFLVQRSE